MRCYVLGSLVSSLLVMLTAAPNLTGAENLARPVLRPGESNWTPATGPFGAGGLMTLDLNSGLTPTDLATELFTGGITVTNVTLTGANHAAGLFSGGTGIIGFESGILLSSGNIASVAGPNVGDAVTTNNGTPGDADLNALVPSGLPTFDATVLEFDFECTTSSVVSLTFVFSSEEYNEYVGSAFNDVFGFFLNGSNIALIPGTLDPVSIGNINCGNPYDPMLGGVNCPLFVNNDLTDGGGAINT